mmetsp:Transcript_31028/g.66046  ORF Transcript_31028/g.66046 Transcript_31028/m.66046 type:complete len:92 (-) Transcript_31028:41-316(-)
MPLSTMQSSKHVSISLRSSQCISTAKKLALQGCVSVVFRAAAADTKRKTIETNFILVSQADFGVLEEMVRSVGGYDTTIPPLLRYTEGWSG